MWAPLKVSLLAGFSLRVAIHLSDVHFSGKMTTNSDFASEFGVANAWKRYDVHVLEAAPFEVKVVQIHPGIWTNKPSKTIFWKACLISTMVVVCYGVNVSHFLMFRMLVV